MGRLYRNPCPSDECDYFMYFPKSSLYPDIEIYDPEDENWCGQCLAKKDSNDNYLIVCKNQTCSNKIKNIEELTSVIKNYAI